MFASIIDGLSLQTVLFGACVSVLIYWICFQRKKYTPPLPPSPGMSLPIVGHLFQLDDDMRKPFRLFRRELGDVYSLQLGGRLAIVFSGYETLKEAFVKNGVDFEDRASLPVIDRLFLGGIVFANGKIWKEHRRFAVTTLKEFGLGKRVLETKIHREINGLINDIQNQNETAFDPTQVITTTVANVICSIVFSGHFRTDDQRWLDMQVHMDKLFRSCMGSMENFLPWLEKCPGDPLRFKEMFKNGRIIDQYCKEIIEEHVEKYDENDINDLISAYIKELKSCESSGRPTTFSYEQLGVMIMELFIAGSESTSTVLRWCLVCLVEHPDIQERLYSDIIKSVGPDRLPAVDDMPSLTFIQAFYLEVMRYCDFVVFSLFRTATCDVVFQGYTVPKGAIIIPDVDSVMKDPNIWSDPESFRPERFINTDGSLKRRDEFIMFFLGKRICPGETFARMELALVVSALVQRFQFRNQPGENITYKNVDGVFGFNHGPKPYKVVAKLRVREDTP